ncbi:hypothetical protein ASPCAL14597 [Aspergillus calidoustus]|uniref:DUF5872 domain-containing protein n=1 Tax=Aspergillus calidoustus TaxID=454130 RepID=A0A0U5GJE6_ASPCI|nr:hypothetical protein ASPCAL14597 [Aspergillus calidoustus]
MPSKQNNYTDPDLRQEVKEEVQAGGKGGKPGQWSARKAQLTASEYKARGGDYTTSKDQKAPQQKNLDKWTGEEWQTKEGSGHAKQDDGTEKRYLPKKAWEGMSEKEKEETEAKKVEGSREGKQFVGNTETAKRKRGEVSREGDKKDTKGKGRGKAKGKEKQREDDDKEGEGDEEGQDEMDEREDEGVDDEDQGDKGDENEEEEEEEEEQNDEEEEEDEDKGDGEATTKEPEAADTPQSEQPGKKRRKKD